MDILMPFLWWFSVTILTAITKIITDALPKTSYSLRFFGCLTVLLGHISMFLCSLVLALIIAISTIEGVLK
jgi:hypothetical protein